MAGSAKRREDRLEIHLPAAAKKILQRAALLQNKSIDAFVLDSGWVAAAEVLADRHEFKLSAITNSIASEIQNALPARNQVLA